MLSDCFSGKTSQVLYQSKQTFPGASQRTWGRPPGLRSAHAWGLPTVTDSTVEALSLPQEKVVKVKSLCLKAKVTPTMSARQLASVLGTLKSCRPAIWQAPLHFRYLQIRLIKALHASDQNFDVTITLDHNSLEDLHWWVCNINSVNGIPIGPPAPTLFITTDASRQDGARSARVNAQMGVGETANAPST